MVHNLEYILFKKNFDLQLIIHNEDEEFWLIWSNFFPHQAIREKLPFQSGGNTSFVAITLTEKVTTQIDRKNVPCKIYSQESDFVHCCKEKIWSILLPTINCKIVGMEKLIPNSSGISECNTLLGARVTYKATRNAIETFLSDLPKHNFPMPCSIKSYNHNIKYANKNSWIDVDDSNDSETSVGMSLSYSSLLVEERFDAYIYDLESLMTSIGGNLGLFLGFSFFSSIIAVLEFFYYKTSK